ncbi:hypothetical protein [Chengkuizengella marina]|uniref:Uncharacterized protein n=1 Tax=Chengkuizengella marina TaxID=2507566 RepID=A0A6N9Q6R1_9BACL|nr:hypothetical protein [Chengkuizengella marina]NBI30546.1 hypothetical protein [Chengkuizengella marina]
MATIVLHKPSNKKYIFLGTGFGAYKSSRSSFLGGDLFPSEEEGEYPVASVSDEFGQVKWVYTEDLQVLKIDGKSLDEYKDELI